MLLVGESPCEREPHRLGLFDDLVFAGLRLVVVPLVEQDDEPSFFEVFLQVGLLTGIGSLVAAFYVDAQTLSVA